MGFMDVFLARPASDRGVMQLNDASNENAGVLLCMRDNVLISAENPHCPHPSSACSFRELCEVKELMRKVRKNAGDGPSVSR